MNPPSFFITGTDTGVGKTLVAGAVLRALVHTLGPGGVRVAGMKPVAAGAERRDGAWINEDVEQLLAAGNVALARASICPYLLPDAMAPHIAAVRAGVRLELPVILEAYRRLRAQADAVVVEGVGGFRVPLDGAMDTADLAVALGLPVLLVVGLRLGCLNHAALTAEAIAARGLRLHGWVASAIDPDMVEAPRNLLALGELLAAPCLGRIPHLEAPVHERAWRHLDLDALLAAGL
jgi:dethiobiotin synthetase